MKYKLSCDPPKWKIIFATLLIILSDLYVGIGTLTEQMTMFQLGKTVILVFVHAGIVGLMFLTKEEEKPIDKEKEHKDAT